jgi:hypothetical protein
MKEVWGVDKFDICLGNPPYQDLVGKSNTEPIWDKFISKSLELTTDGGYLTMVHPSGWRSPDGRFRYIYNILTKLEILYLSMNGFKEGSRVFGVGTNFDFYCIRNSKNIGESFLAPKWVSLINAIFMHLPQIIQFSFSSFW